MLKRLKQKQQQQPAIPVSTEDNNPKSHSVFPLRDISSPAFSSSCYSWIILKHDIIVIICSL